MSHALIAHNKDLCRLKDEGYILGIVDQAYLLVENVPYVNAQKKVLEANLVMDLTLSGDITSTPNDHTAYWTGEFPHNAKGEHLTALLIENAEKSKISCSFPSVYMFSAKPDGAYRDYYHKVTTYVEILGREARQLDPSATAQHRKVMINYDNEESAFHFADTASTRNNTTDLARLLQPERVAIVGSGGTGSYVLDFIAKTWVQEIHVFDDDQFLQHNAFRSPGSYSREDLKGGPIKSTFHAKRYASMRKGIFSHETRIQDSNVNKLGNFNTVFLCIDGHLIKKKILETCLAHNTLLIDVGMGMYRMDNSIAGILRTTTIHSEYHEHSNDCIGFSDNDTNDEYDRNIQIAELNALNAALAVIKWKKIRGFYNDLLRELNCEYVIDGNKLINSFNVE